MPIVRTFITVIAGVGRMNYRTYTIYSVIGGVLWARRRHDARLPARRQWRSCSDHIELILIGIVALSLLPVGFEVLRHRSTRDSRYDEPEERARVIDPDA